MLTRTRFTSRRPAMDPGSMGTDSIILFTDDDTVEVKLQPMPLRSQSAVLEAVTFRAPINVLTSAILMTSSSVVRTSAFVFHTDATGGSSAILLSKLFQEFARSGAMKDVDVVSDLDWMSILANKASICSDASLSDERLAAYDVVFIFVVFVFLVVC